MTTTDRNRIAENDRALEDLLGSAAPRPTPAAEATAAARAAVHEEWRRVTRRRAGRRRLSLLAVAASLLLAVTLGTQMWRSPAVEAPQVATLEKSIGTIYLLGERSELREADTLEAVRRGQTIVTGRDAGAGLRWVTGGSLRLAGGTEVRFSSADAIELVSGRVYFDSMPRTGGAPGLTIVTELGEIRHVGTQFAVALAADSLTVRVREGRVAIEGRFHDVIGTQGQQLTLRGSRRPEIVNIEGYGPDWQWVEATASASGMNGRMLHDVLAWASRETGLGLEFESEAVERVVRRESVAGDVSDTPRVALRQSLLAADLSHEIDNGVIRIRQAGNPVN